MHTFLLQQFAENMEKQEILSRMTEAAKLHGYSYSEIHTIDAVGSMDYPNTTNVAEKLHLTRGAVSKIAGRLQKKGLIESYQKEGNRQKVFYRLTPAGKDLFAEHVRRHAAWLARDDAFLKHYPEEELEKISQFMKSFNQYLDSCIKNFGEQHDDD